MRLLADGWLLKIEYEITNRQLTLKILENARIKSWIGQLFMTWYVDYNRLILLVLRNLPMSSVFSFSTSHYLESDSECRFKIDKLVNLKCSPYCFVNRWFVLLFRNHKGGYGLQLTNGEIKKREICPPPPIIIWEG